MMIYFTEVYGGKWYIKIVSKKYTAQSITRSELFEYQIHESLHWNIGFSYKTYGVCFTFIGPCIIVIVEEQKTNFMSLVILFHFLCTQHVSDINTSIIRSLRLFCWITTLVYCSWFDVCWSRFGWVGVVSVLQAASACNTDSTQTQPHQISNTQRTEDKMTDVVIQQHSRKLLMMDILVSETCWVHKKWNKIASDFKSVFYSSTYDVCLTAGLNICTST